MRWLHVVAFSFAAALSALETGAASATSARLLLPVQTVKPGETFLAGVELTMKPGWHTYWRYGGDSGKPTGIHWKLPAGLSAGDIRWPAPERLADKELVTYIYHGKVILLVPITVSPTTPPGAVDLSADVDWLECEKQCLPGKGSVRAALTIGAANQPSGDEPAIRDAEARLPKPLPAGQATVGWDGPAIGAERTLLIRWQTASGEGRPDFFPAGGEGYRVATATEQLPSTADGVVLRKKVEKIEGDWPRRVEGVLALLDGKGIPRQAWEVALPIGDTLVAAAAPTSAGASKGAAPAAPASGLTLFKSIAFGFLGGLILNVMPCVLPVIALKILGFVRQSGSRPAEVRRLGWMYGLGVWFSFIVLAGVVISVKRATGIASWGMQFGSPVFLVAMTTLILLVALSLFGVFEINLAGRAMDAAGDLASREGSSGAFFNGMLAVALATPCTAPFLAPALGYAFTASASTILLVFSAIAVGLAAPYVILSSQPAWLKFLPKPGAWMEHFKIAMGFPMLATALWLYTLAADRLGEPGPLWLGIFLVGMALATWVWGEFAQRGTRHQGMAMIVAGILALGFYFVALERELDWRGGREAAPSQTSRRAPAKGGIAWEPWSKAAVAAARQAGRPVLVDFTANWCFTCKVNERSSLNIPAVREKLAHIKAVALKGDHTRLPPAITEELLSFGRAGVPLVVVYPRDSQRGPIVLPEILTPSLVLNALDQAAL